MNTKISIFTLSLLFLSGCASLPKREMFYHVNTRQAMAEKGDAWYRLDPQNHFFAGPVPMTGSMRPAIWGGEFLLARRVIPGEDLRGYVVSIKGNVNRLHRVKWQDGNKIVTQGDANAYPDRAGRVEDIVWVVVYVVALPQ